MMILDIFCCGSSSHCVYGFVEMYYQDFGDLKYFRNHSYPLRTICFKIRKRMFETMKEYVRI